MISLFSDFSMVIKKILLRHIIENDMILVLCNHYYIIIVFYSTLNLLAIGLVLCYHYYIIIVFIVH